MEDWRKFEQDCFNLVRRCFPDDKYRVEYQRVRTYDGQRRRMDISIAERRPGGHHYVIECKHWPGTPLNKDAIRQTLEYKTRARASKAIILLSASSMRAQEGVEQFANRQGILVIRVSTINTAIVQWVKNFFFKKEMQRIIP